MSDGREIRGSMNGPVERGTKTSASGDSSAALLLARWWMKKSLFSYLIVVLMSPLISLFMFVLLVESLEEDRFFGLGFSLDYVFLAFLGNLAVNWASLGYLPSQNEYFRNGLSFLRCLPVSVHQIVRMRMLVLALTLMATTPLVFVPPYLLYAPIREVLNPAAYFWFVAVWALYGFVSGCVNAYLELGFQGWTMSMVQFSWLLMLLVVAVTANLVLENGLVAASVRLVLSHGPLAAGLAVLVAVGSAVFWFLMLERCLKRRDLIL